MKWTYLLIAAAIIAIPSAAQAACNATYPVGSTSDGMVSFLASGTNLPVVAPTTFQPVEEGTLVYDSTANALKLCDGTSWAEVGGGGGSGSFRIASGKSTFTDGNCTSAASACSIDISSGGFATAPYCTVSMEAGDGTGYTENMVIQSTTSTTLKVWKGNYQNEGTTMRVFWMCSTGSGSGGSGAPGGADTQVQFNDSGAFNGDANLVWDNVNKRLGIGTASPTTPLHISGTAPNLILQDSDGTGAAQSGVVSLRDNGGTERAWFGFGSGGNDDLALYNAYSTGSLIMYAGGNTSNVMILNDSGNVGIGTATPALPLDVRAAIASAQIRSDTSTNAAHLQFYNNGTTYVGRERSAGGNFFTGSLAYSSVFGSADSTATHLAANGAVHMTVDTTGNVGIGTTSPVGKLHVAGNIYANGFLYPKASDGTIFIRNGSSGQLLLAANSGGLFHQAPGPTYYLITTSGGSTSDSNVKSDVIPIKSALEKLSRINGVEFNFSTSYLDADPDSAKRGRQIGVVAQDVEKVFPEAVGEREDGLKTVSYDKLIAPLIEAVKELKSQNEKLREDFEAYKAAHP